MNQLTPKVTIGLPVYNGERYLQRALDSLLRQSWRDFELVISDNCSTDGTGEICQRAARRDNRIRYIRQSSNIGANGNFNFVASQCRGEYFKWAAHDDICDPTFLQRCVDILDRHPDVIWCHSESDQIDSQGKSWKQRIDGGSHLLDGRSTCRRWKGHPRKHCDSAYPSARFVGVLLGTNWSVDSYGLIRIEALRRTNMLLPIYGAEKVLIGELALQGPYYHVPELLFSQRIHDAASSNLQNVSDQARFAVGGQKPASLPRFALLRGHVNAIRNADLPVVEKAKCMFGVLRYLLQVRKWRHVMLSAIQQRGVGDQSHLNARKQQEKRSGVHA